MYLRSHLERGNLQSIQGRQPANNRRSPSKHSGVLHHRRLQILPGTKPTANVWLKTVPSCWRRLRLRQSFRIRSSRASKVQGSNIKIGRDQVLPNGPGACGSPRRLWLVSRLLGHGLERYPGLGSLLCLLWATQGNGWCVSSQVLLVGGAGLSFQISVAAKCRRHGWRNQLDCQHSAGYYQNQIANACLWLAVEDKGGVLLALERGRLSQFVQRNLPDATPGLPREHGNFATLWLHQISPRLK